MTLNLERQSESKIPVEVDGITPDHLVGLSEREIACRKIWLGRRQVELGEIFSVRGRIDQSQTIRWTGELNSVNHIGAHLKSGRMEIETAAGRHVGSQMTGGSIVAKSDVSDYAGAEMTGGTIQIIGNAGDAVGGNYSGSKCGMNRGEILVAGNVGRGCGQSMRRGTIAIGGNAGQLCGWNMLAGTIVVFGDCGLECGAGMKRGTIVLAGQQPGPLWQNFVKGGSYEQYLFSLTANSLRRFPFLPSNRLLKIRFEMHHGDLLYGGRGEIFVAANS